MARISRNGFLAIAVVFHLIYIFSIFDIYFVSPIVSGMRAFSPDINEAPAKRLVLFVGDGLRADKAFQSFPDPSPGVENSTAALRPRPLTPFLRSRVLSHGTFGVSHTRVPTESRPGHVALIAGLYEDVSSVTTGWKLNPVNFDSVFNRSRHTWSWGSPDILPMFKEGAVPGRVDAETYSAEAEDYTQDATQLDTWVFDKVKAMFKEAERNNTLNEALRQDKNVFFLHLLGLDTTGHAYRPYSREYLNNIKVVDKGVQEITDLIERFYGDDQTAFVFTADHGMSDWGSHGDGHPDNTRTPLIAWGSGVAKPSITKSGKAPGHEDGLSLDWGLEHVRRHDVAQADVAALMAYLAGLEFPVNSVGELPLSYLAADSATRAKALAANAKEILEMYRVKEEKKKASAIRYKPYKFLGYEEQSTDSRNAEVNSLIQRGQYDQAITKSLELMHLGLGGLRYLQTYDWLFLRTLVTGGYLGWIAFAMATVVDLFVLQGTVDARRTSMSVAAFMAGFVAICSLLYVQSSSWTYYAYAVFPAAFWEEVYARRDAIKQARGVLLGHFQTSGGILDFFWKCLAYLGLLEALVQSYFHREVYTFCYLAAIVWPFLYGGAFVKQNMLLVSTWTLSCATMSLFTLLSPIKVENLYLILLGGLLMFSVGLLYLIFEKSFIADKKSGGESLASPSADNISRIILGVQVGLIALAMIITKSSVTSLQARKGLPLGTQILGWIVLVASLTVPFLHRLQPNNHYIHRLVVIFLTFSPLFIILTISYEGLFYFAFCTTVLSWVRLEHHIHVHSSKTHSPSQTPAPNGSAVANGAARSPKGVIPPSPIPTYRALTLGDARISLFFLFLLQSAFFSTGNIASISSFSLDAVYRLIPVFDPFSQGALLMIKLMVPFAVISANLGILNRRLKVAPSALFMVVMAISDVMTMNFFYMVKDEGSWLDIGTTISHFCIASLLCVFVAGLESVSELFVGGVEFDEDSEDGAAVSKTERGPEGGKETATRRVPGEVTSAERKQNGRVKQER